MNFTTKINIPNHSNPIDYNSKIVSLGSCFAENMGDKFQYFKFQSTINPFGIIFNPVSIERIIDRVVNDILFTEEDIFFYNERWHSFEVHSDLSHSDATELLENLNQILRETKKRLEEATHIIITYGTSWVYRSIEKDTIVANCHKVPQKQFAKELLSVEISTGSIKNTINLIQSLNPNCNFIFTVSPVRHLKDGFVENQRSKSHLITTIHNLQSEYFPSYEIMMDELRDYRFYADDMVHPSQVAIDYIWEQFKESTISETAYPTMDAVESIQKGLQHRPFNPQSENHKKFEVNLQSKIATLVAQYSFMKF
ncbi:GSCFA domain-containing protein [Flavobacterium sp. M31R6]|uniref:GSCFA domain-containing protein n=1 Tax=Flavobacterium sp. M31R6 TaxID=2739062 RepID=UPI001568D350|nr:GSCFA domain-containing protein [Flavobacterium sp. M31R6]QKJ62710.1 GSCFA domain-containing protein [Flavobacterium sp. M31R6]